MTDTSPEALLAWCEAQATTERNAGRNNTRVKWEAFAAIVRAHQERPTRAQVEALRRYTPTEFGAAMHAANPKGKWLYRDDVLALYGPEASTTGGEKPSDGRLR